MMKDNSYAAIMARKNEIIRNSVGMDYESFEKPGIVFDYEAMMAATGYTLPELQRVQALFSVGNTPLIELRNLTALATPFASRALDRGLAGVLLSLVRQIDVPMNGNKSAKELPKHEDLFAEACRHLLGRASTIMQDNDAEDRLKIALEKLRDEWLDLIRKRRDVSLGYVANAAASGLMAPPDKTQEPFSCPNSLRDVEKTVTLLLDTDPTGLSPRGE